MKNRTAIWVLCLHPVLLGFICALLDYFLHIPTKYLIYGASVVFFIGIVGLLWDYVIAPIFEDSVSSEEEK